jgi:hypothetical protein
VAIDEFTTYFRKQAPAGLSSDDAVQLCMRHYCTADGTPKHLHVWTSTDGLTEAFAALGGCGWIQKSSDDFDVSSRAFWSTVVSSVTKRRPWILDEERGRAVMYQSDGEEAREGIDDWDKSASIDIGANPRR